MLEIKKMLFFNILLMNINSKQIGCIFKIIFILRWKQHSIQPRYLFFLRQLESKGKVLNYTLFIF